MKLDCLRYTDITRIYRIDGLHFYCRISISKSEMLHVWPIHQSMWIYLELFLQDLKGTLAQELDFENEGRNGERCFKDLKCFPYVHVPKIHWDKTSKVSESSSIASFKSLSVHIQFNSIVCSNLSIQLLSLDSLSNSYIPLHIYCFIVSLLCQRVLTAEYIDGCKVSDKEAIQKMGLTLKDVKYLLTSNTVFCNVYLVHCCLLQCLTSQLKVMFYGKESSDFEWSECSSCSFFYHLCLWNVFHFINLI